MLTPVLSPHHPCLPTHPSLHLVMYPSEDAWGQARPRWKRRTRKKATQTCPQKRTPCGGASLPAPSSHTLPPPHSPCLTGAQLGIRTPICHSLRDLCDSRPLPCTQMHLKGCSTENSPESPEGPVRKRGCGRLPCSVSVFLGAAQWNSS